MTPTQLKAQDRFYQDRSVAIEQFAFWEYLPKIKGSLLTFGIKRINGDYFVRTRLGYLPINQAGRGFDAGN